MAVNMAAARKNRASQGDAPGSLDSYHAKRDFTITAEPRGKKGPVKSALRKKSAQTQQLSFVVQKHDATRLHYDFRLEAAGVLASWAIPKGPSLDPKDKRLAMHVEDHPLEYGGFEGTIPKGQYGAGPVILWDRGTYTLAEGTDPKEEIANGKIKFIMHGKRLHGMFTLVRIHGRDSDKGDPWLLIKDRDDGVVPGYDAANDTTSVKSGKTIEEIEGDPRSRTWNSSPKKGAVTANSALKERIRQATQRKPDNVPQIKQLMMTTLVDKAFDNDDWLFEIKWDGYRALCTVDANGHLSLVSRNGNDLLKQFPDMADLTNAFGSIPIIVDGEIVSLDGEGHSSFQGLQEYAQKPMHLTYVAFDVLYANGRDLRKMPLEERKELLEGLIQDDGLVMYSKHVIGEGVALFEQAEKRGYEGIIGKRRDSTYEERRSPHWVKIKAQQEQEFVVGGWSDPRNSRKGFGALLLGVYENGKFRYVGNVGTGFTSQRLSDLSKTLAKYARATSPFDGPVEDAKHAHWVDPKLVVQIRFAEWTHGVHLRQAAFLGIRTDVAAKDVKREQPVETVELRRGGVTSAKPRKGTGKTAKPRSNSAR
jgi:bifunctional non-homologous end joining protein LigD